MDYRKIKEINEKILEKAMPKVERALLTDKWDCECMETLSMAIDNIKDIAKIESMDKKESYVAESKVMKKTLKEQNEFDMCVEDIIAKHGKDKGVDAIMLLMSEVVDDIKVIHPKMYETIMMRLRELK